MKGLTEPHILQRIHDKLHQTLSQQLMSPVLFDRQLLAPPSPKADLTVCMAVNEKQEYVDFVRTCMKQWHRLGIKPVVIVIGGADRVEVTAHGVIQHVKKHPTLPTWIQAMFARLYSISTLSGVCFASDIDLLPLDRAYYDWCASYVDGGKVVATHTRPGVARPQYVFCHVMGYAEDLAKLWRIRGSLHEFLDQAVTSVTWQADERYLDACFRNWPAAAKVELARNATPGIAGYRVFRDRPYVGPAPVDFHAPRPYTLHRAYIEEILRRHTIGTGIGDTCSA